MFGYIFMAALVAAVAGAGAGYWWRQRNIDEDLKDLNLTRERLAAGQRAGKQTGSQGQQGFAEPAR